MARTRTRTRTDDDVTTHTGTDSLSLKTETELKKTYGSWPLSEPPSAPPVFSLSSSSNTSTQQEIGQELIFLLEIKFAIIKTNR